MPTGLPICCHRTSEISSFNHEYMQVSKTRVPISRCTCMCFHRRWWRWPERGPRWSRQIHRAQGLWILSPAFFSTPRTYGLFLIRIFKHVLMEHGGGPLSNPSTIAVFLPSRLAWIYKDCESCYQGCSAFVGISVTNDLCDRNGGKHGLQHC